MVITLNIKNNILSYIYDKNYCICLYDNNIYIYNYKKIDHFNDHIFYLTVDKKKVKIEGNHLHIGKLTTNEIMIEGKINDIQMEDSSE